jgi:PAS domain-containing protein
MDDNISHPPIDATLLQQIVAGLPQGVIIVSPDKTIIWANESALAMHGVKSVKDLGDTISDYRGRFELRYRNSQPLSPDDYPMDRLVAGERFTEVVVEVVRPDGGARHGVQRIRSLVLAGPDGQPGCVALIIADETEQFDAEDRFERAFAANPAPAVIARLADMRYVKVNQGSSS